MDSQWTWECWRDPSHHDVVTTPFGWPQCGVCRAAPPYHERPAYLPAGFTVNLYTPVPGSRPFLFAPRSGIVGVPLGSRVNVYYEGWVHGPAQYADRDSRGLWEAGIEHAASRMITGYPTVAQACLPTDALAQVGTYDPRTKQVTVDDEPALNAWLNQESSGDGTDSRKQN